MTLQSLLPMLAKADLTESAGYQKVQGMWVHFFVIFVSLAAASFVCHRGNIASSDFCDASPLHYVWGVQYHAIGPTLLTS